MKNIVIVGGGYGGISLAKELEKQNLGSNVRILLIEKKSHFYHTVAGLRAGVQDLDESIFIPYSKLFASPKNQVLHATVTRFNEKTVYLSNSVSEFGDKVDFDFLVIASGTRYSAPARVEASELDDGKKEIQRIRQKIQQAQHILIVGAGPVGLELAGEIRDVYTSDKKKVTLIHSQPQLGNPTYMPTKVHHKLMSMMASSDIDVVLNDKVELPAPSNDDQQQQQKQHSVVYIPSAPLPASKQGHDLSSVDLVLMANGNQPDAGWVATSFGSELVQADGYIKVKSTLQVDHPTLASKVFVMGDIAGLQETKLAFRTVAHASVVSANIVKLLQQPGAHEDSLKHYKKGADMMLITFGQNKGVTILPWGIVMGNWVSSTLKSKTLFIDRYWKELNQVAPRASK